MKKRTVILIVASALAIGLTPFVHDKYTVEIQAHEHQDNQTQLVGKVNAKIQDFTLTQASKEADLIVKVKINGLYKEINEPAPKTLHESEILEVFKGPKNINPNITIMQQGNSEWSFNDNEIFQKDDEYYLFLKEATGNYENTYWILGEESTIYKIESDEIVKQSFVDNDLSEITKKVEKNEKLKKEKQHLDKEKFLGKLKKEIEESEKEGNF
jgi:hypothetical protein